MSSIKQALAANKVLRINNDSLLGLVQSFDWSPELGAQDVYELGNFGKVDTSYELRASGNIEVSASGSTAGLFARMIPVRDETTEAFEGYVYDSGGVGGKNEYTFTEADLIETRFDLIQHERPDSKDFTRSLWFPRCQLASYSGSARADGQASETLTWQSSDTVGFNRPFHDIKSIPCLITDDDELTLMDDEVSSATHTLAYVYVGDRRFRNAATDDDTKFALQGDGTILMTTTEGYVIPEDADCHALVFKTAGSTTFPAITDEMRGTSARYIRGSQVNVYIAPANVESPQDTEKFLKVQSLDWSIDMGLTELMELQRNDRGTATYCRVPTLPFSITCNATVYESDWGEWKALIDKSFDAEDGDVYDNTYEFAPSVLRTQFAIVVEYWTKSVPALKLQTWTFPDMAPSARGTRTAVRGRGELTWSFTGTQFILAGETN